MFQEEDSEMEFSEIRVPIGKACENTQCLSYCCVLLLLISCPRIANSYPRLHRLLSNTSWSSKSLLSSFQEYLSDRSRSARSSSTRYSREKSRR